MNFQGDVVKWIGDQKIMEGVAEANGFRHALENGRNKKASSWYVIASATGLQMMG